MIQMTKQYPLRPEMKLCPAGAFLMGSDRRIDMRIIKSLEPEQYELDINYDYMISKYPITVGQYREFLNAGGYQAPQYWLEKGWHFQAYWRDYGWPERVRRLMGKPVIVPALWCSEWTGDDCLPVVGVSWHEAWAYCSWLSEITGCRYRLPLEAEWEKSARGSDGRIFPWGNELESGCANINWGHVQNRKNRSRTSSVGSYIRDCSPYGVMDMAGNVNEWCLSQFHTVYRYPEDKGSEKTNFRTLRGGSWYDPPSFARAAFRMWMHEGTRDLNVGFRVVMTS